MKLNFVWKSLDQKNFAQQHVNLILDQNCDKILELN